MIHEATAPVRDVLIWLARVDAAIARRLLVGCLLDDGVSTEAVPILDLDIERKAVTLQGGRRLLLAGARNGEIIDPRPDAPLIGAIGAQWTAGEVLERDLRAELGQAGIDADRLASDEDRRAVLAFLRAISTCKLPGAEERHRFYRALSAGGEIGLARIGARVFAELAGQHQVAGKIPDDLYWRWAWFLRVSRQLHEAISVSDTLHSGKLKDQSARKLLATIRAATLLDLFESISETKWLTLAERAAKIAYAISPTDAEVKMVHRRLQVLKTRLRP